MIETILESGLQSVALWLGLTFFFYALFVRFRSDTTQPSENGLCSVRTLVHSRLFLIVLGSGVLVNLSYGLYKAYVNPRDIMQDIVSADQLLQGESLYPENVNQKIRDLLEKESPRGSLFWWDSNLHQKEIEAREITFRQHWVQAHPPLMTLLLAPFVSWWGTLGAQVVFAIISVGLILLTLIVLFQSGVIGFSPRDKLVILLLVLASEPVISALRLGQSGPLLGALMTLGWLCLRRDRAVRAGIALGVATSLKLYPGLLLPYLLLRNRRAFLSALGTIGALALLTGLITGWSTFQEFYRTAQGVVPRYEAYPGNISFLGALARSGLTHHRIFFYTVSILGVGMIGLFFLRGTSAPKNQSDLDLEYAVVILLMPLLSPIAWDHYLSILIMPLMILGSIAFRRSSGWGSVPGLITLIWVLCLPDTLFTSIYQRLLSLGSGEWGNLLILSMRAYVLILLVIWSWILSRQKIPVRIDGHESSSN